MFKKWTDIENHYRSKYINKFFSTYPNLYNETYYITEKIDGANFSIIIPLDEEIKFAKRSSILKKDEKFYNYETIFYPNEETSNYDKMLSIFIKSLLLKYVTQNNCTIQLVGELFGKGIQKRVYYGEGRYWKWFATYKDQVLLSIDQEVKLVEDTGFLWEEIKRLRVPQVGTFRLHNNETFEEKLNDINLERNSLLTPSNYKEENLMEGVVVRPLKDYYIGHDRFIIKYKNEKFKDVQKKNKKPKKEVPEEVKAVVNIITGYVNSNRTQDLFSKYGEIEEPNQLGEYIKYYLEDVYNDFNKSFSLEEFSKENKKYVNKQLTNEVVKDLRNYL